ncbi:DNA polymerase clamp loader subunit A [uncultured Arcobacter sp.]|uniref:DNA polymerase clamp loader subunit A n=1 Tax=uncultured Arcobacter sp. TaxID=165434 RepID=UPI00260E26BC|nr:DNA polymerase clamp loader subunit A [uncultured Arcobacter sp.]
MFDILKDISEFKTGNVDMKKYNAFMINRFVSMLPDTMILANLMNQCPDMPVEAQYQFYLHAMPKKRRFFKYIKDEKETDKWIEMLKEYYDIDDVEARDYAEMFTEEQLIEIYEIMNTGGLKHE